MFMCRPQTLKTVPALAAAPAELFVTDAAEIVEATALASRLSSGCDVLIVDHYGRNAEFERDCQNFARCVMAFDDRPNRVHDCDLLLDPTPSREVGDYRPLVPDRCRLLLGPEFVLLRSRFAQMRPAALARHALARRPARLFVSMGMTDPQNRTAQVLEGIAQSGVEIAVDIALGSSAPHLAALRDRMASLAIDARLHLDTTDIAGLMASADLGIGAAGSSSFERCCLGLPSLMVVVADNQRDIASSLVAAGAALVLDGDDLVRSVADALGRLCADGQARVAMSEAAAGLCDGRGAERVVAALARPALA